MARFQYRDESLRTEMIDVISGIVWGAVKDWQRAAENRPQMTKAEIETIADDYLFEIKDARDCVDLIDAATIEVLARANRAAAAVYL